MVRCLRRLGERPDVGDLALFWSYLQDPCLAVRAAAAAALGHIGRAESRPALERAWEQERSETGLITLSIALARCGAPLPPLRARLERYHSRTFQTCNGPRQPAGVTGLPPAPEIFADSLGDGGAITPRAALRAQRQQALRTEAEGREGRFHLQALALLQHPDDVTFYLTQFNTIGRRGEHTLLLALGSLGDPRALPLLKDALFATDVDPGRGFTQRRLCAMALGRLGFRDAVPWLLTALENEALDYEGRPGAGMGVQYPVRTTLLWALGELADPRTVPTLLSYLGNTAGSALGGFYLPAIDALARFPRAVIEPSLRALAQRGGEIEAAHAISALAAAGGDVLTYTRDPRRAVADLARRVTSPSTPPDSTAN